MGKRKEEYNPHLKALILQVVDNQITGLDETGQPVTTAITDDPEYVKNTFTRLSAAHGPVKAKEMIAAVLLEEMYDMPKYNQAFNEALYKGKLEKLK